MAIKRFEAASEAAALIAWLFILGYWWRATEDDTFPKNLVLRGLELGRQWRDDARGWRATAAAIEALPEVPPPGEAAA